MTSSEYSKEEAMKRLLSGDAKPSESPYSDYLKDEAFRQEYESLRALQQDVDWVGEDQNEILGEVLAQSPSAAENAVLSGFEAQVSRSSKSHEAGAQGPKLVTSQSSASVAGSPSSTRRFGWVGLAAAATILAIVFWKGQESEDPPNGGGPDPIITLGHANEAKPHGEVESFDRFSWKAELPPGGWYELKIFSGAESASFEPLVEVSSLEAPAWQHDPSRDGALPPKILWEVVVFDSLGQVHSSFEAEASRRSLDE